MYHCRRASLIVLQGREDGKPKLELLVITNAWWKAEPSLTGNRTRAAAVKAPNPNH